MLWFIYYVSGVFLWILGGWMTTCLGKSCSFCLPRVPFVGCRQFVYLVISLFPFWFWGHDMGSDCISSWSLLILLLSIRNPRIFKDDILSSNICIPLFIEDTQKNCIDPESNQEPLDHHSCILPLHWSTRWRITTERVFLNNGDDLNYNLYWFFNDTE